VTPFYAAPHKLTTRRGNEEAALASVRKRLKTAVGVSFEVHVDQPPRRLCSGAASQMSGRAQLHGLLRRGLANQSKPKPAQTSQTRAKTRAGLVNLRPAC
jgi:hypothetical protein